MDYVEQPAQPRDRTILELREFSRKLVRELGFMRSTLANSELAPSACHAILEIGVAPGLPARDLANLLRLDKSNTSRQLAKLEAAGLVYRETASDDARSSQLFLTEEGQKLRRRIDRFATDQVSNALRRLVPEDQQALVRSLALYADALALDNDAGKTAGTAAALVPRRQIETGYRPGCIGDIAGLHGRYYVRESGLGSFFERRVATELAEFADKLPASGKELWCYVDDDRILASIAIDGDETTGKAHLRWFIVDDALRGTGIGRQLLTRALDFVDARFNETFLWTFKGLDAARHLYESEGFMLTHEAEGTHWGKTMVEQRFNRPSRGEPRG
ncbi:helix-turn-helix domain-containing GNAT family N-acetyltransferase [Paraburkholderia rhizosphaerae]|uniref:MarR family transcriptional regulator with acetyltransferase activity n=1 Tax=Paraburkholderia rhizosphaerae TaxID=480658 RepID=A0A4R8LXJ6_9BURK|nr:helix-turn-helix domain-containing GNAT family N-acetyltransferase [Paraburkholderia rhizosphaerae]TDY51535.1 MarR family transcriptional regulator with acetyltransferase activity [Paraburkholderia rhizosphaerae]